MAKKKISPINEDFDFKLFVTIAKKNMLWFMLFMLVSIFSALIILRYTAPTYESSVILKIANEDNAQNVLGIDAKTRLYNDNSNAIAGDIELIKSKIIIKRAIEKLPLKISYFSKGAVLVNELYKSSPFSVEFNVKDSSILGVPILVDFKNANKVIISYTTPKTGKKFSNTFYSGKWINLPEANIKVVAERFNEIDALQKELSKDVFFFTINNSDFLANSVIKEISIGVLNLDAQTIQIKLKDKNSVKAADIVNSVADEFNKYDVEKNSEVANKILDFIDNTIKSIDAELVTSETSLELFKRTNRIISPEQAISTVTAQQDDLLQKLRQTNTEIAIYESISKDIQGNNDIGKFILSLAGTSKDNQFLSQLTRLQQLVDERDQVKLQATDNAEITKALDVRIKTQKDVLRETITNEGNTLRNQKKQIENLLKESDSKFGLIPAQQAEYGRLVRLFNINEKFYSLLLEKKAEFSITRAGYVPKHIVLQEGVFNTPPVSPNRALIISVCLMLGFIASFILIITRYLLYNEINALEEIGQYTEAALLGIVPKYKREIPVSQLLVDKNPKSVISESFRSIRTNLQFISNEDTPKIIAVTSTISGEGKTFNAINLAGVIAFSGKRVVILDLDMRKPKIHLGFGVENDRGMSTLLIGKDVADNCITHSSLANLDFITAGPIPPNPAELIINQRMSDLLEYLKGKYDIIIADLPPVGIVSDGIPILQLADYPLYILRANYSKKMFIAQLNKLMTENKVKNLSVILNGVEMSRLKYGYGYGYSYGYGYGYGYSYGYGYYEEDDQPKTFIDKVRHFISRREA
ncbi:MAG TPA: polysaccharide biosynthesis tyrosine autokinase [Bacteroidia bacterium]|jgi:capsular exopolysaccharide synthesis family protein|nr:polysaccharide biosynthesis tyrosine autokinase [Bacteroidia bacterium]HQF28502.1 polysaccharide biosynthesis tyrosine autokinase [Bacteroidia bacterium]HQK96695.1 polysaccharide biosynthesis tyrosine autokinase [Bacteroidia bacterium]